MYATMKNDSSRYFLFRGAQHCKIIENWVELRVGNSLLASKASQNSTIWNDPKTEKTRRIILFFTSNSSEWWCTIVFTLNTSLMSHLICKISFEYLFMVLLVTLKVNQIVKTLLLTIQSILIMILTLRGHQVLQRKKSTRRSKLKMFQKILKND